jgi:nitrogen-specific signal transduction histidine kinase
MEKITDIKGFGFSQALIDSLNANVAILNKAGEIIASNRAWEERFAGENSGVGANYLAVNAQAAEQGDTRAADVLNGLAALLHNQHAHFTLEYPCPGSTGATQPRWFYLEARPLPGCNAYLISHTDITNRKLIEATRLESDRRFQQLLAAEREERLQAETLARVTLALAAQTSLEDVLDEILAQAHQLIAYDMGNITLVDGDRLRIARQQGYTPAGLDASFMRGLQLYLADLPLDEVVIRSRRPLVVKDTHQERNWKFVPRLEWIRACLILPITRQERVVGLLVLDSDQANAFSDADAERLQPLAHAAAVALENARLYEQARREIEAHEQTAVALRTSMAQIEQARQEWEATVDALPQLICLLGKNHLIIRINQAVQQWQPDPVHTIAGKSLHQVLHPNCTSRSCFLNDFYRQAWRQLEQGLPFDEEGFDPLLNRYLHLQCRPIFQGPARIHATILIEDLSTQKRMEEAMLHTQKLESLGVMAGGVAHNFNNLLTGIVTEASLIGQKLPADHPVQIHLNRLIESTERGARLAAQLLTYAGKGPRQVTLLDLNQLIVDNMALLQTSVSPGIVLKMELAADLPTIEADAGQIQQVLMNLILNAAEAYEGRPGQVVIRTLVEPVASGRFAPVESDVSACFLVKDEGMGIRPEMQSRIFDPFFTTKPAGRGLGLATVQRIVRSHHGQIELESYPNVGTQLKVLWPASSGPPPAADLGQPGLPLPQTILVIDDELAIRVALTDMLALLGITVLTAENGLAGLERFQKEQGNIDVVLLDLMMPVLSGPDTFFQLRAQKVDLPIILFSGYSDVNVTNQLLTLPGTFFLSKPFHLEELLARLQTAMAHQLGSI